jgi:hypothetical protein
MNVIRWLSAFVLMMGSCVVWSARNFNYPAEAMDGPEGRYLAAQSIAMGLYIRGIDIAEQQSAEVLKNRSRLADGTWDLAGTRPRTR